MSDRPKFLTQSHLPDPCGERFPATPPSSSDGPATQAWLEEQCRLYERALNGITDAVFVTDCRMRTTFMNEAARGLLNVPAEVAVGRRIMDAFTNSEGRPDGYGLLDRFSAQGRLSDVQAFIQTTDGVVPVLLNLRPVIVDDVVVRIIGTCRNLTEQLTHEAELKHMAHHDPLTGLPNRWFLDAYLPGAFERVKASGGSLAALFVDLDRFKLVNDELGFSVGDNVLVAAAKTLRGSIRKGDTIVRLGGDEFIILAEEVSEFEACGMAERICDDVRLVRHSLFANVEPPLRVTASIGVVVLPGAHALLMNIIRLAERAKRVAKEKGKDRLYLLPRSDAVLTPLPPLHS